MSHGSYTSLDSLAQNGILNFDANAYLNGTPPRYIDKPYGDRNYSPFEQPLMNMPSPYGMGYGMGYGMSPMGYQAPWSSVRPSMHAQPRHDEFAVEKAHDSKNINGWLAGITAGVLGTWGVTKFFDIRAKKKAEKAAKKAAEELKNKTKKATIDLKDLKGFEKVKGWFKNIGIKLTNAPKWVKISGITTISAAGLIFLLRNVIRNKMRNEQTE